MTRPVARHAARRRDGARRRSSCSGSRTSTTYVLVRRELQENALANLRSRTAELRPLVVALAGSRPAYRPGSARGSAGCARDLRAGLRVTDLSAVLVGPDRRRQRRSAPAPVFALARGRHRVGPRPDAAATPGNDGERPARQHRVPRDPGPLDRPPTARRHRDRPGRDQRALARDAAGCSLAGLVVLLLAVGVAVWLARRLTRPIREIERAAGQLATGDLTGRADVPPGTDAELAELGAHAQRDGRAARSSRAAASARSCSRSRTTCARRSRRSAATRRRSPTARSTTPTPTRASAPRRSSAARRAGSNGSSATSSTSRASTAASSR